MYIELSALTSTSLRSPLWLSTSESRCPKDTANVGHLKIATIGCHLKPFRPRQKVKWLPTHHVGYEFLRDLVRCTCICMSACVHRIAFQGIISTTFIQIVDLCVYLPRAFNLEVHWFNIHSTLRRQRREPTFDSLRSRCDTSLKRLASSTSATPFSIMSNPDPDFEYERWLWTTPIGPPPPGVAPGFVHYGADDGTAIGVLALCALAASISFCLRLGSRFIMKKAHIEDALFLSALVSTSDSAT
jgi:hypothetical protein